MESRWVIPPFRGKSKNAEVNNSDVKIEKDFRQVEIQDMKERIKQLEGILLETDEEHRRSYRMICEEFENLGREMEEIRMKTSLKRKYDAICEKIEAQKLETQEIKNDINKTKAELENLTQLEENLYFELQVKKEKIKDMREEILRSSKELQVNTSHFKVISKELQEKNENLLFLNKNEALKNQMLQDFLTKAKKKKEKEDFKPSALLSEFRVLKIQLQSIDKEISEAMNNTLNHSNSIISQTFDYTDTSY